MQSNINSTIQIQFYLKNNNIKKLHVGAGNNVKLGWLNTDFNPTTSKVVHLDAKKLFPFENNVFDYIFIEHMIEHITYEQGLHMLSESYRVLDSGGKIRISTPNLDFLMDLYKEPKSKLQHDYIQWATQKFVKAAPFADSVFVINNFVRDWGHLFIYNEKILRSSLERAGFHNITKYQLNVSEDKELRDLENEKRLPSGFLQLESFTLEAQKP